MTPNPYHGADKEILAEVVREAESYLSAQLQSGLAADTRATSFVSVMAAAAALIAAAGFGLLTQDKPSSLGYPALLVAGGFLLAMALASYSARPTVFFYCGNAPSAWKEDIRRRSNLNEALSDQLMHYDEQIMDNRKLLRLNARCMSAALVVAWLALLIGGIWAALIL